MVIIAAVDRSSRADEAVRQAKTLADAFDDTVHVVHVLTRSEFVDLGTKSAHENKPIDMESVKKAAASIAEEAAAPVDGSFETVGLVGDPADRIVDYADTHDARYITVVGRKRSPAGKAIFGSVGQSVVLGAECPVVLSINRRKTD